ncbi:MAG: polysaccharide biosynthesis/export family protein [Opitutaceae bacterium]|nr:polysaccharide biosynthesis/export family protein [Opitutaceae bacterium]
MKCSPRSLLFLVAFAAGLPSVAAPSGPGPGGSVKTEPNRVPTATKRDYVLQPQDVLKVHVFGEEDINKGGMVSITQEYTVTLPLIQTVNLKGLTVRQAEEKIRQLYDKDFLVEPQVNVFVEKYAERSVNVVGAVEKAGRIPFPQERGLSIVDAIALAGGQSRLASLRAVKLTRTMTDGEQKTITVDVDAIMKGGERENIMLQPDDLVFVPERIL